MGTFKSIETALDEAGGDDYCYLTTRGRVSGEPHEIEIWFALDAVEHGGSGTTLHLLAGAGVASDWVRNLMADPAVTVRVRDVTYDARGRVITGTGTDTDADNGEERRARDTVFAKYQPRNAGELVTWRERALPVALDVRGVARDVARDVAQS
jgi:deazaflavin-dependent oxidoreductase (nitroreductase family)